MASTLARIDSLERPYSFGPIPRQHRGDETVISAKRCTEKVDPQPFSLGVNCSEIHSRRECGLEIPFTTAQ